MPDTTAAPLPQRRRWDTFRDAAAATWLPWLVTRAIVLAALALARFIVSHLHVTDTKAVASSHAGLVAWDGGWYVTIAAHGYAVAGLQSLRFFPLYPLIIAGLHHGLALPVDAAAIGVANVCAFGAAMGVWALARDELGDEGPARSAVWLFSLVPPAFVTVMGYSDALMLLLAVWCFWCLRRHLWWGAAVLGLLAGATRPIGILLVVPALWEVARGLSGVDWRERGARAAAVAGPALGLLAYLWWAAVRFGSFTRPLTLQDEPARHGNLTDPLTTLWHDGVNLLHGHHVGSDLHLPWVVLAVLVVILAFRTLPAAYGLFSVVVLAVAASGSNLDSFERYAFAAFPLVIAASTLLRSRRVETAVLVLAAAGMLAYAVLAFLGAYVP